MSFQRKFDNDLCYRILWAIMINKIAHHKECVLIFMNHDHWTINSLSFKFAIIQNSLKNTSCNLRFSWIYFVISPSIYNIIEISVLLALVQLETWYYLFHIDELYIDMFHKNVNQTIKLNSYSDSHKERYLFYYHYGFVYIVVMICIELMSWIEFWLIEERNCLYHSHPCIRVDSILSPVVLKLKWCWVLQINYLS